MAKRMKNKERELTKLTKERLLLVNSAMDDFNCITKSDISKKTGLSLTILNNLISGNRELNAKYVILKRQITDIASDNIVDIIKNKDHPQNFQASKYVLQKYKNDLDDSLESSENLGFEISADRKSNSSINIVFGKKSEDNE